MKSPAGKALLVSLAAILAAGIFATGYLVRHREAQTHSTFHDMRINHIPDLVSLVEPHDPAVRSLANRLGTPEAAYAYVLRSIRYAPMVPGADPGEILRAGVASCLGKATLLCSIYRAMGIPASDVRLIVGNIAVQDRLINHVWIDLEYKGACLQQDPSGLLGLFEFGQFQGMEFTRSFVQEENFCFNDEGFAVVSQLNRYRNGM